MKMQTKLVLILGLSWGLFLLLTLLPNLRVPLLPYLLLGVLAFLCTSLLLKFLVKSSDNVETLSNLANDKELTDTKTYIEHLENELRKSQTEIDLNISQQEKLTERNIELEQLMQKQSGPSPIEVNTKKLMQLAHYDELTALPNQIFFHQILNKAISHVKRRNQILALLCIDIDGFKKINTNLGRDAGDSLLKEMSQRILAVLRSEDILARSNGDEFIVLLNDIGKAKFAGSVAEKILAVCQEPFEVENQTLKLSISIGICVYPDDGNSLEALITNVEKALYQAKRDGGSTYKFYRTDLDVETQEFLKIEKGLRQAIKNGEFVLYYQPKMHIKNGNMSGVEALIRWAHPEHGLINPNKFLPIAEETGFFLPMAEWALNEACQETKFWQMEGYEHLTTSINLSPNQFYHPEIASLITAALKAANLNAKYLELEVNESTVMDDIEKATLQFNLIKEIGVQLSIDHFGIGYTSISHLKKFPINTIKIDRSFIKGIPQNPNDMAIVNAFIALGHNLGLEVIAEGVETAEQVQYLSQQGCDVVQGYFLSHPLPAIKIIKQFKKLREEVLL